MARWKIVFSKEAHKQFNRLPTGYHNKVELLLQKLAHNALLDIRHIKGELATFRIRLGKYRILFKRFENDMTYLVFRISTRGDA